MWCISTFQALLSFTHIDPVSRLLPVYYAMKFCHKKTQVVHWNNFSTWNLLPKDVAESLYMTLLLWADLDYVSSPLKDAKRVVLKYQATGITHSCKKKNASLSVPLVALEKRDGVVKYVSCEFELNNKKRNPR